MRIEAVPIIRAHLWVPRPVRALAIDEYDAGTGVFLIVLRPDAIVAPRRAGLGAARPLKPWMPIRSMIDYKFSNDANAARVGLPNEVTKITERAVIGMNIAVITDIITIIQ